MKTQIDVMRHGEPEGGRRYRGFSVNDPLTEKGWKQMWGSIVDQPPWDLIVSSPLARCLDFSLTLSEEANIPCVIEEDIKEIGFGVWEGLTPEQILAEDSNALTHFYADPVHNRPEGAESLEGFSKRVWDAYQAIAKNHEGKHILIVGHAGVARAIVANVLGMSLDNVYSCLGVEYAAMVSTVINEDSPPKMVIQA